MNLTLAEGAQTVTRHGKKAVVVLAYEEYQRLVAPKLTLVELIIERSRDLGRTASFE